jgi:hypothetical protein
VEQSDTHLSSQVVAALCSQMPHSRRVRWPDTFDNLRSLLPSNNADVILIPQVEPELSAVAAVAAEPHRRVSRDGATKVENTGDEA